MKNIILCFFIIPVMTLSVFAEEVTFNDFEEITHESKPALRHKKTKEIYPITFSEKFYSPDKTMYAVFADANAEKWYKTQNPIDFKFFRFVYVYDRNNERKIVCNKPLREWTDWSYWYGKFIRISNGPGWPGTHFYVDLLSGELYKGGNGLRKEFWISENDFLYNQEYGITEPGAYTKTDVIREEVVIRKLVGSDNGITKVIFPITNVNDYIIQPKWHENNAMEIFGNINETYKHNQPAILHKRYFSYYPTGKFDIDKYKYIFKKELKIDKSGKILSTSTPPDQYGVCLADNVRIRTSPDLNGTVVGHLKKDDTFEILDASESTQVIDTMEAYWYKIKTTTLTGWVYGYFIIGKPQDNDQR